MTCVGLHSGELSLSLSQLGDDVKGLTKIMNGYMDAITQPILDSDGMVIKYIGDASMHIHKCKSKNR